MSEQNIKDKLELVFDDNRLFASLCGEFDENLFLFEKQFNIEIITRGNHIILLGNINNIKMARLALESLYALIEQSNHVDRHDIEGIIRMAKQQARQSNSSDLQDNIKLAQIKMRKTIIKARTPMQNNYINAFDKNELVFGIGPAGTGKTYLGVAQGVKLLERKEIDRIILSRPAVEAGENLGFLPGDLKEKVDPYLRPLYDALYDMMEPDFIERAINNGIIEIAPLAFMRGRTLSNALIILDEAQNTTRMQMKMFLTRLGENSKMIVTGDPSQIDLPRGVKSGLLEALDIVKNVQGVNVTRFSEKDVVRHELVGRIVKAYNAKDNAEGENKS